MPTNTGFKGIDVYQTANQLVFDTFLQNSAGGLVTGGTTTVRIYERQSDGTYKQYDFSNNTFTTGTPTTPSQTASYQKTSSNTNDTGLWTLVVSTLTGFTLGATYRVHFNNSNAFPTDQMRAFQFGASEGDDASTYASGIAYRQADIQRVLGNLHDPTQAQYGTNLVNWRNNDLMTDPLPVNVIWWYNNPVPQPNIAGVPITDMVYIQGSSFTLQSVIPATLVASGLNLIAVSNVPLLTCIRNIFASACGISSGAGSGTEVFEGPDGTTALTITVGPSGNRTAVIYS